MKLVKEKTRYFYENNNEVVSEINFKIEKNIMHIDRVYTNEDYRGHGYAKQLLEEIIDDAKNQGYKINPICSFVVKEFSKNKDYQKLDVNNKI